MVAHDAAQTISYLPKRKVCFQKATHEEEHSDFTSFLEDTGNIHLQLDLQAKIDAAQINDADCGYARFGRKWSRVSALSDRAYPGTASALELTDVCAASLARPGRAAVTSNHT